VNVQALIYRLFRGLSWLVCRLPRFVALGLADSFAACVYRIYRLTPYKNFIAGNLATAFPQRDERWLNSTVKQHLQGLARGIVEILRFERPLADDVLSHVSFVGWENVEAARGEGRGVIIATAHFGNWELLGAALAARGLPLHVLVQQPSQEAFGRLFQEFRAKVGVSSWPNTGAASLRPVLRALARGEALGMLADQHGEALEAIVEFFGHRVSAPAGPFFFAKRTGAAILPVFAVRQSDGNHVIHILAEIAPSLNTQADAQSLYATYEQFISRYPDQWLWVHNRWARTAELQTLDGERGRVTVTQTRAGAAL
jgi:KDO2-lipid IV(A) lauroyltransferase